MVVILNLLLIFGIRLLTQIISIEMQKINVDSLKVHELYTFATLSK